MIISSPVGKTGTSQEKKKNLTGSDATSNPKSLYKLGMASHPYPSLVCYNCFHVLTAEARSYHHGDASLLCFISNLQNISYSGWQGCNRLPLIFFLPTTRTDFFSYWSWDQTSNMFRENSFKMQQDTAPLFELCFCIMQKHRFAHIWPFQIPSGLWQ